MVKQYWWVWLLSASLGVAAGYGLKQFTFGKQETYTTTICVPVKDSKLVFVCQPQFIRQSAKECQDMAKLWGNRRGSISLCALEPNDLAEDK